jgi:hypothetical protein
MLRILYECLLLMHPPAFRREFTAEMLCIYDEAAGSPGACYMILDGFVSLARQWLLRSGFWKLAVAVLGAGVQVTAGGFGWIMLRHHVQLHGGRAYDPLLNKLIVIIVVTVSIIALMVATASIWMTNFVRKRA